MTVKQFFKSTAFKCIIALLCVLLASGVFLTIMNGLLEVTDEERFQRALAKIYGRTVETEQLEEYTDVQVSTAKINSVYRVTEDGNYLIKSTGKNAYSGGSVTCWIVVLVDGTKITGIGNVVIDSNSGQSYISKIPSSVLGKFSDDYEDGIVYEYGFDANDGKDHDMYIKTNASYSMRGICNAVNGAIEFANSNLFESKGGNE